MMLESNNNLQSLYRLRHDSEIDMLSNILVNQDDSYEEIVLGMSLRIKQLHGVGMRAPG